MTEATDRIELGPFKDAGCEEVLAAGAEALTHLAHRSGWSTRTLHHANLVVEELAMNVLTHGAPARELTIQVRTGEKIEITVADTGAPFDPLQYTPAPREPNEREVAVVGGLGLALVKRLASQMHYVREDGRNQVTVTILRAGSPNVFPSRPDSRRRM